MAAQSTYIEEYLAVVKPSFDSKAWERISGQIKTTLSKPFSFIYKKQEKELEKASEKLKALNKLQEQRFAEYEKSGSEEARELWEQGDKEEKELKSSIADLTQNLENGKNKAAEWGTRVARASVYLGLFSVAVNKAKESALQMAEKASEISNKFLTQSSVFVDKDTRNIMGKFGVNATTAQAIGTAADELDIDLSDYSKLTQAQRKAFSDLMNYYQQGINNIDTEKLEKFNKITQKYQLDQVKLNIKLKTSMSELLAESDGAARIMGTLSNTMESIGNILSSDAVQTGFNFVMDIIDGILKFVTTPINWLGSLFGGGNTTNTTTNQVTTNTTINTSGGVNAEQLAVDIGLQVQNAMTRR